MQRWLKQNRSELGLMAVLVLLWGLVWASGQLRFVERDYTTEQVALVQERTKATLIQTHQKLQACEEQLQTNSGYVAWGDLLTVAEDVSVFIFRDEQLVFWSDHHIDFSPDFSAPQPSEQCIKTRYGIFLVCHQRSQIATLTYDYYALVPLQRNYRIENSYLSKGFNADIFPVRRRIDALLLGDKGQHLIYGQADAPLFSFNFGDMPARNGNPWGWWLLLVSLLLLGVLAARLINRSLSQRAYWQAFALTLLMLVGFRWLAYQFDPPSEWLLARLFEPQYFAWSRWSPSLGDLFINVLLLLLAMLPWLQSGTLQRARYWPLLARMSVVGACWLLSFVPIYGQYAVLKAIYLHSTISMDITWSLSMEWPRLMSGLIFLLISTIYFLSNIYFWQQATALFSEQEIRRHLPYLLLGGGLLVVGVGFFFVPYFFFVFVLFHAGFALVFLYYRTPHVAWGFTSFLFLAACAIVQAWIGVYVIWTFEEYRQGLYKERFAEQILEENDGFGEVLLYDALQKIREDALINRYLQFRTLTPQKVAIKKIDKFYLGSYFDKYDVKTFFYDRRGMPHQPNSPPYDSLYDQLSDPRFSTSYRDIFFVSDVSRERKQYMAFLSNSEGRILIRLTLKKYIPNSIYPNLLLDNAYMTPPMRDFSYVLLKSDEQMIYHWGDFPYDRSFMFHLRQQGKGEAFTFEGHRHWHTSDQYKRLIISTPLYSWRFIFSNFSFLFLLQLLFAILFIPLYRWNRQLSLRFSTKIQIYLNIAFFVPLLLVGVLIIGLLNNENIREMESSYRQKSELAARNIADVLADYLADPERSSPTALAERLAEVARLSGIEIHLFDRNGDLLLSNQPVLYDSYLLAGRINPQAKYHLLDQQQNVFLTTEQIGRLTYNAVYVDIEESGTGQTLGILGIPFFESGERTERQIIDIFTIILNTFTIVFVLLIFVSYFLSRRLIRPLELIREKMQQVSLREKNLPLSYQADDEIGALVKEYNKMISKLEDSKQALARSEKESAWREMAKQVAHEIKNPLTPMKLTLQHLQRSLDNQRSEAPIRTLLTQIDTLSDIANSFSVFAKMPVPKEEVFDVRKAVQEIILLYENHDRALVTGQLTPGKFRVKADAALIGRILTNLILNGIQSVPVSEVAKINIELYPTEGQRICVSVRDNGCGIPPEHAHKIFVPSFTTKSSGSGIGLAVAKKGIEHAGGKIWFESTPGVGTVFFVELPIFSTAP
ncbi:MAG: ATP-binding protein [Bernardetiaceae bacterium]